MRKVLLAIGTLALVIGVARADWDPGDPYKMHFPQLPDPTGWDIDMVAPVNLLADDWQCSVTGDVSDIHFWYSWAGDQVGQIDVIHASIYNNALGPGYSEPGSLLWTQDFVAGQFSTRFYGTGNQGYWDIATAAVPDDHVNYYQCNITNIAPAFSQVQGEIYWLALSIEVLDPISTHIGWKTSLDHFMDSAVDNRSGAWEELYDPLTGRTLDFAFVITPEPGSLIMLAGGLMILKRRR
jgi:hypothetical protein